MIAQLILRRANVSRKGPWQHEDFDVFDGERDVGRIYLVDSNAGTETWFWGASFQLTGRKSYGHATSLSAAKGPSRQSMSAGGERPARLHQRDLEARIMPEIIESKVIPWDGVWGVAIRYANGTKIAYPVGGRQEAERELLAPRPPWPEPVPDDEPALA
jgi:hypothetical protein